MLPFSHCSWSILLSLCLPWAPLLCQPPRSTVWVPYNDAIELSYALVMLQSSTKQEVTSGRCTESQLPGNWLPFGQGLWTKWVSSSRGQGQGDIFFWGAANITHAKIGLHLIKPLCFLTSDLEWRVRITVRMFRCGIIVTVVQNWDEQFRK